MANILGFDVNKLIGNIGDQFGKLVGDNPFPAFGGDHENPFAGIGGTSVGNPFGAFRSQTENPFGDFPAADGGNPFGTFRTGGDNPFGNFATGGGNPFGLFPGKIEDYATNTPLVAKPPTVPGVPGVQQPGSGPVQGLEPGVAQWDGQVQSTFADLGGWVPNAMLAIIQHESHGIPTAQNPYASAHGLFQQLDLTSNDPQVQMQAAKQLAQQKLAQIQNSYAANGLNPDERTRARDLFLAWAGHFDYATGQPNPNSSDLGSGQRADQFLSEIMPMYDNIARGRQAPAAQGSVAPNGAAFPVVGYSQQRVELHHGSDKGASDIFAPEGAAVVAMRGGRVVDASYNTLGGWSVSIEGEDGLTYYYAHLYRPPSVQAGQVVATGTYLGGVGDTGNAKGTGTHLHLGIGHGIQTGDGATGGSGRDFDAVSYLNNTLWGAK